MLTADEFLYMYHPQKCAEGAWAFRSRGGAGSPVELTKMQTSWREWRKRVVIVAGDGWEGFEEERRDGLLPWPVYRVWGEPSEQAKKSPELHGVYLKRVETAGAWARAQETRRKHWNDPEWILQPRHLEISLSYRGLDKAMGRGMLSGSGLLLLAPNGPFFPETRVGPPPGMRNVSEAEAGGSARLRRVERGGSSGQKRAKVGNTTPRSPRRVAVAASVGGFRRKSDRLKGKCAFSVPGSESSAAAGVDAEDPIPLSDGEDSGLGQEGGGMEHRGRRASRPAGNQADVQDGTPRGTTVPPCVGAATASNEVDIRSLTIAGIEQLVARLRKEVEDRDTEIAALKRREEAVDSRNAEAFREGREVGRLEGEGRCLDRVSMELARRRTVNRRATARAVQEAEGKYGDRSPSSAEETATGLHGDEE